MRVVIAEDNSALAHVLQFNFEKAGFETLVTHNGLEAWRALQAGPCDLLITDHQMPELTGVELCQRIRSHAALASLPVIFLTAKRLELELARLKGELGVGEVFGKPFSPNAVVRKANEILAEQSASKPLEPAVSPSV